MKATRLNMPDDRGYRIVPRPLTHMDDAGFSRFSVQPSGPKVALSWKAPAGTAVFLYRSRSGISGSWERLNDTGLADQGVFHDMPPPEALTSWRWRAVADPGGPPTGWKFSEVVGAFDIWTKKEWALARAIQRREIFHMAGSKGNGIRAFLCKPRDRGIPAANYDEETGQVIGIPCPDQPEAYGQLYEQGFYPPFETWAWILEIKPKHRRPRQDASGVDESRDVSLRLPAFPEPERGDLLILPDSDRRWVLADAPQGHYLRANLPLFYEAQGLLVEADDFRSRFIVRDLPPETPIPPPPGMGDLVEFDGHAMWFDGRPVALTT
jgi:hypothetical protein